MQITIRGRIPSKKNSKQIVACGKYPRLISSKAYLEWHKTASKQLAAAGVERVGIDCCEVYICVYFPDLRRADLTNKAESIMDLLVDYGVLADDNWQCVRPLGLDGELDRADPRAEIVIIDRSE